MGVCIHHCLQFRINLQFTSDKKTGCSLNTLKVNSFVSDFRPVFPIFVNLGRTVSQKSGCAASTFNFIRRAGISNLEPRDHHFGLALITGDLGGSAIWIALCPLPRNVQHACSAFRISILWSLKGYFKMQVHYSSHYTAPRLPSDCRSLSTSFWYQHALSFWDESQQSSNGQRH
ncbi:hypothetical protein SprV_0301341100 [Sparganum proliferum]